MTRLVLLIILGVAVWSYFPESRHFAYEVARPAMTPLFRWQTKKEMNEIARGLQNYERENFGRLPSRRAWPDWLQANYQGEAARDSWGGQYLLTADSDSFRIVSPGPDQIYRSEDDLQVARRFARTDRGNRR